MTLIEHLRLCIEKVGQIESYTWAEAAKRLEIILGNLQLNNDARDSLVALVEVYKSLSEGAKHAAEAIDDE